MTSSEPKKQKTSEWVAIISAVKTPLAFFVFIVLVVEVILGAAVAKSEGQNQALAIYGMVFVFIALIAVVSLFTYFKPDRLLHFYANIGQFKDFCNLISGHWWQKIALNEFEVLESGIHTALSFLEIWPDPATNTVKIKGESYNIDCKRVATWESVASCINVNERKVFYYWKGRPLSRTKEPYEGFGEIFFVGYGDSTNSGDGFFSDTNLVDMKSTTIKSFKIQRCKEQEIQQMYEGNTEKISKMIQEKMTHMAGRE